MKIKSFEYEFVEFIPKLIEEGKLYISIPYKIMKHKCACGCGSEIALPIDEIDGWTFTFYGYSISLSPSIGNWELPCRSHYIIRKNQVIEIKDFFNSSKKRKKIKWFFQKK